MSLYDYQRGRDISNLNAPFYAVIQAAMRQANTDNLEKLKGAFPDVWAEFVARYSSPDGILPGDHLWARPLAEVNHD